ncbi:MAG: 1-(5-phosphoribosyl)-5-[(5-phosphoribosylamino)methylideneamino]imidazole-4-carboxamide isomerase [Ruminococcaceae bacterium]|nr:1-(5-phosphoribosyl)-5-[(5-phosphoribosylamino)methylideneamino]imidazole-4-carboxamide isomerase [Oscillospiraceae bacterium]
MIILPAIDLSCGEVVRLLHGDYNKKTVYSDDPVSVAKGFYDCGASEMHVVDLDGAKEGYAVNADVIERIVRESGMRVEVGGGIRNRETVQKYISCGVSRIILGTAALRDPDFLCEMVEKYGEKIAVGVDIKNGNVAVNGWLEDDGIGYSEFLDKLESLGVKTVIVTDISKDGAMQGTNRELYRELSEKYSFGVIASGGVSHIDDVKALNTMNLYGAIVGRAIYNGGIDLREAVAVTKGGKTE